jgi:rhodanese-related sulfurtransferase
MADFDRIQQISQIAPGDLPSFLKEFPGAILLDVRQPWENELVALENSELIPLGELSHRVEELPEDVPIVVYCHHGVRSLGACSILAEAGFQEVFNLSGGIDRYSLEVDAEVARY